MSVESQRIGLFQRFLYRSYAQAAALREFVAWRVTPLAWLMIGILFFCSIMGSNVMQTRVFMVWCVVAAALGVAFFWGVLRRGKSSATRQMPPYASVGQMIDYAVRVRNEGKSRILTARVVELRADARPSLEEFVYLREPQEEGRNSFDRFFAAYRWHWLCGRGKRYEVYPPREFITLDRGEEKEVHLRIKPLKRGKISLDRLRLLLPDPLGLFQQSCRIRCESPSQLLVLPKSYPLPEMTLSGENAFQIGGEASRDSKGESLEFLRLRDYRVGDPLKSLHWRSSARKGRPIVKEYEDIWFPRYGLILDTCLRGSNDDLFEEAVAVAASFVAHIDRQDCMLDLMFLAQKEPQVMTAGRGLERASALLEALALVKGEMEPHYRELTRIVQRYTEKLCALVVILPAWSDERSAFIEQLMRLGIELKIYVLAEDDANLPTYVSHLRREHVAKDLMAS